MRDKGERRARELLRQGTKIARKAGVALPAFDKYAAITIKLSGEEKPAFFASALACFYLFERLHKSSGGPRELLVGDYFYGLFTKLLIPLDSGWLAGEFSKRLTDGGAQGESFDEFAQRITDGLAVLEEEYAKKDT